MTPIIDCDVHEDLPSTEAIYPYFSEDWREFVELPGVELFDGFSAAGINPWTFHRTDATPPGGGAPGSSPPFMIEQLLDPLAIDYAVLTGDGMSMCLGAIPNPHLGRELARALNDYRADQWFSADPRFVGSICLPVQVPEWAAEEVRRCTGDARFVQAVVGANPHSVAWGHPIFDPVHRALAESGRPLAVHAVCNLSANSGGAHMAAGKPSFYNEFHGAAAQEMMSTAMSFIFHGVFERYPSLKVVLVEGGSVGWIAPFLKRLDADFKGLRREVPWCKKMPSEYFADHFRVTTQPFDHDDPRDALLTAIGAYGAEDFLVFATDYPHWDADVPKRALAAMPRPWRDKVAYGNAVKLYGLKPAVTA